MAAQPQQADESSIAGPSAAVATTSSSSALPALEETDKERCCICLMTLVDRTVVGECSHEFCFSCIGVWANQSRKCPLCNAPMLAYLVHDLDAAAPTKFFLAPLPEGRPFARRRVPSPSPTRKAAWRAEQAALARRRDIYERGLYAKHVASNAYTGFRANPSPRDVVSDGASAARARSFLVRELRVWAPPDDVESLADHIVALLGAVDVRSDAAVRLLAPLVDGTYPHAAEHLAHELYTFLRSPFAELSAYDEVVQYDAEPAKPVLDAQRVRERRRSSGSLSATSSGGSGGRSPMSQDSSAFARHSRSRSPSRRCSCACSHSSRSRSRDRDLGRSDTFRPDPSVGERRWDQPDSWIDPEYADELARRDKQRKRREQRSRARERKRVAAAEAGGAAGVNGTVAGATAPGATFARAIAGITANAKQNMAIKGAADAAGDRRQSLLDRLAKARGDTSSDPQEEDTATEPPVDTGDRVNALREQLLTERKRKVLREQLLARKRAKSADAGGEVGGGEAVVAAQ